MPKVRAMTSLDLDYLVAVYLRAKAEPVEMWTLVPELHDIVLVLWERGFEIDVSFHKEIRGSSASLEIRSSLGRLAQSGLVFWDGFRAWFAEPPESDRNRLSVLPSHEVLLGAEACRIVADAILPFCPADIRERRFLVVGDRWRRSVSETRQISQGFLGFGAPTVAIGGEFLGFGEPKVAIRSEWCGSFGCCCLSSGNRTFGFGMERTAAADMMRVLCEGRTIGMNRHFVPISKTHLRWAVDEFTEGLAGLVLASVRSARFDTKVRRPKWIGEDVSNNPSYSEHGLASPWRLM